MNHKAKQRRSNKEQPKTFKVRGENYCKENMNQTLGAEGKPTKEFKSIHRKDEDTATQP